MRSAQENPPVVVVYIPGGGADKRGTAGSIQTGGDDRSAFEPLRGDPQPGKWRLIVNFVAPRSKECQRRYQSESQYIWHYLDDFLTGGAAGSQGMPSRFIATG